MVLIRIVSLGNLLSKDLGDCLGAQFEELEDRKGRSWVGVASHDDFGGGDIDQDGVVFAVLGGRYDHIEVSMRTARRSR